MAAEGPALALASRGHARLAGSDSGLLANRRIGLALGLGLLLVATSCRGNGQSEEEAGSPQFGPLAVSDFVGGDQAVISGSIQITDDCVLLDERGESVLLVWPQGRTTWDNQEAAVLFVGPSGEQGTFRDGDAATFSGGGSSTDEDGTTAEDFLASVVWISEPNRNCLVDNRWFISDLVIDQ